MLFTYVSPISVLKKYGYSPVVIVTWLWTSFFLFCVKFLKRYFIETPLIIDILINSQMKIDFVKQKIPDPTIRNPKKCFQLFHLPVQFDVLINISWLYLFACVQAWVQMLLLYREQCNMFSVNLKIWFLCTLFSADIKIFLHCIFC